MDSHQFFKLLHQQVLLKRGPLKFTFPISSFVLSSLFEKKKKKSSSSVYPVWIGASRRRQSFNGSRTAEPLPVGLQCQAMTPMCLPAPPPPSFTTPPPRPPSKNPAKLWSSSRLSGQPHQVNTCSIKTWRLWGDFLSVCLFECLIINM